MLSLILCMAHLPAPRGGNSVRTDEEHITNSSLASAEVGNGNNEFDVSQLHCMVMSFDDNNTNKCLIQEKHQALIDGLIL